MSKRYIPQTPNNDFVYPNNDKVEYDETILHEINNNVVSGTISNLALSYTGPNLVLDYDFVWNQNGAEVWVRESGLRTLLSVHMLAPGQDYFKPWKIIDSLATSSTTSPFGTSVTRVIAPSYFGLSSWPSGEYVFEFRFVGLKENYVLCETATLAAPPTPTPTFSCTCISYSVTNNSLEGSLSYNFQDCESGLTIYRVLGPGLGESICACSGTVVITEGSGDIVDLGPCSAPTPTPTPSPTSTSTPTPTPTASCTYWFLEGSTQSGELLVVEYNNCAGDPQQITLAWNSTPQTAYICAQTGSVVVVDQGLGTSATNTGTPCS